MYAVLMLQTGNENKIIYSLPFYQCQLIETNEFERTFMFMSLPKTFHASVQAASNILCKTNVFLLYSIAFNRLFSLTFNTAAFVASEKCRMRLCICSCSFHIFHNGVLVYYAKFICTVHASSYFALTTRNRMSK